MNRDISQREILDDILSRWHGWAKHYVPVPTCGADPMFRNAKSSKQWDTTEDIVDAEISNKIMKAVDFQVTEMANPYQAAIYVLARNCYTGRSVWMSPRLPQDPAARGVVIAEARAQLTKRLVSAGVM